jgi:hypothetical protein
MTTLGVVNFTHKSEFERQDLSPDRDVRIIGMISKILKDSAPLEKTTNWPKAFRAICRDGLFVVEASDDCRSILLRFDPNQREAGDYQIREKNSPRVESGQIREVSALDGDINDRRLAMLMTFPTRFKLDSISNTPPHARMVWRVGLESFVSFTDVE